MLGTAVKLTCVLWQWWWNGRTDRDSHPALSRRERPRGEPAFWAFLLFSGKNSWNAKCVCRKVAVSGEVSASGWCGHVCYDSLGL